MFANFQPKSLTQKAFWQPHTWLSRLAFGVLIHGRLTARERVLPDKLMGSGENALF